MIAIRADANKKIGMGHVMRCMSIAWQLRAMREDVLFIISEDFAKRDIEKNGFCCICLKNRYNEKDEELPAFIEIIKSRSISKVLLDSYEVTYEYMSALKQCCWLGYIDDLNAFRYPVDLLINYIFKTDQTQYVGMGYEKERFLLGERYVPLRPEFGGESIVIKEQVEGLFLTTGGTDEFNMILDILKRMQSVWALTNIKKRVVTGKFYPRMEELRCLAEFDDTIEIYHDITDIRSVMCGSDIAISAGGTTLMELCACGLPTVCFAIAENQLPGTMVFAKEGIMLLAGNAMTDRDGVIDTIVSKVEMLVTDFAKRETLSKVAKKAIDGKGAYRIAQEIICMQRV